MWSPAVLPVQVEEELQRVASKRQTTADNLCRLLLQPLSIGQSFQALSQAGASDSPLQELSPILRSIVTTLLGGGHSQAQAPWLTPGQDLSSVTGSFAQLGIQDQQQHSFAQLTLAPAQLGPTLAQHMPWAAPAQMAPAPAQLSPAPAQLTPVAAAQLSPAPAQLTAVPAQLPSSAAKLTPAVVQALVRVADKKQLEVDEWCIEELVPLAEADALEALGAIERVRKPVTYLSSYLAAVIKRLSRGGDDSPRRGQTPRRGSAVPTTPPIVRGQDEEPASTWRQPQNSPASSAANSTGHEQVQVSSGSTTCKADVRQSRIHLPQPVQEAVDYLCFSRNQVLDDRVQQELAAVGEHQALYVLARVDEAQDIKSLSSLTSFWLREKLPPSSSTVCDVSKDPDEDDWFEPEQALRPLDFGDSDYQAPLLRDTFDAFFNGTRPHTRHLPTGQTRMPNSEEDRALGNLEFRKRSLVLQLTANAPEDLKLLTAHDLEEFREVPFDKEKSFLTSLAADRKIVPPADMWSRNSSELSIHECTILPDGHCTYQGRTPVPAETALLRTLGDRVLLVRSDKLTSTANDVRVCSKVLENGISLGFRHYQYFIHKDPKDNKKIKGGKSEKLGSPSVKCYFVCLKSYAAADFDVSFMNVSNIRDLRNYFCHIETTSSVAKFITRLQLLLSKTVRAPIDVSPEKLVEVKEDVEYKDSHGRISRATDGAGLISLDLARRLPASLLKGQTYQDSSRPEDDFPLLSQVRGFVRGQAIKGTLLAVNNLKNKIVVRESMEKVPRDPNLVGRPTFNSLEVVTTSRKPREASVSKELIMLLSLRHVPDECFLKLASNSVEDVRRLYGDLDRVMKDFRHMQGGTKLGHEVYRMVAAGMDPTKDLYLRESLNTLAKWKYGDFRRLSLPMPKSWFLMGTADPTDSLEHDQIALILDDGPVISKKSLVYKHPGLHPGDIRVKECTWTPALEAVIPTSGRRNVVIFSTKGPLSAPEEVANSDLDGDLYWVCINPELTSYVQPFQPYRRKEGAKNHGKRPADMSPSELERKLHDEFLTARFKSSSIIGLLCWHHTAHLDRLLTLTDEQEHERRKIERILDKIVDCHQEAVDSDKTGIQAVFPKDIDAKQLPHYMENRSQKPTYHSSSIIGKMYDLIDAPTSSISTSTRSVYVDPNFEYGDFKDYMEAWRIHFDSYRMEITDILRDRSPSTDEECENLFVRYRKVLYGAETLKESTKPLHLVLSEASAIYKVVYCRAYLQDIQNQRTEDISKRKEIRTRFAWGVALHALCLIHADKQPGQPVVHAYTPIRQKIVLDD